MDEIKVVSIFKEKDSYYAALPYEEDIPTRTKTHQKTAVDVNVGHFNYTEGQIIVLPAKLQKLYKRIKHYQRFLARKRKVNGKLTAKLVNDYDQIVIEDLAVKQMIMMHVASKGMQRSLFGKFRQILTYKCDWYGKELILADKTYPSTQRCAQCGYVKKGDEKITLQGNKKYGTKHNEYICYECGYNNDRDENAVLNLLALAK